jgi:hypothetical protein
MMHPLLSALLVSCAASQDPWIPRVPDGPDPIGTVDTSTSENGIVALPDSVDPHLRRVFSRYTKVLAPNGKPIHILVQDAWREEQVVRARKVLEHFLRDVPGSRVGADKRAVANAMSERRATLALFDDEPALQRAFRGRFGELELGVQDLRANESPVEGDPDYMKCGTRDASFEEILHLVHDYGIRPALPEYDEEVHRANVVMTDKDVWRGWPDDEPENHRNEYLAAIYDNYLDLWLVCPSMYEGEAISDDAVPAGTSHFGRYRASSRARLKEVDPRGFELLEDWLPPHLTYTASLPTDFEGTFSIRLDAELPYTTRSAHLDKVEATGERAVVLLGNERSNELTGGAGDDVLEGAGGDDALDGGAGRDVAVLSGKQNEYGILSSEEGVYQVHDNVEGRDGDDVWIGIEVARFADGERTLVP